MFKEQSRFGISTARRSSWFGRCLQIRAFIGRAWRLAMMQHLSLAVGALLIGLQGLEPVPAEYRQAHDAVVRGLAEFNRYLPTLEGVAPGTIPLQLWTSGYRDLARALDLALVEYQVTLGVDVVRPGAPR